MTAQLDRHTISVVVPVYRGETSLPELVAELAGLREWFRTPAGHLARVEEVLLVHDCGPDGSDRAIRGWRSSTTGCGPSG